jgi:membrane-associated phospholipid phosphatase
MTSPTYRVEKTNRSGLTLPLNKRILLIAFVWCIQMIYIPTSHRITGGIEPKLSIDIFPISPAWVLPYVLSYPLWVFGAIWFIRRMDDRLFRALIVACIVTFGISALTFIFFPTYVRRAVIEGNNFFTFLLHLIHGNWGRYDAFPSGHVYITALIALFFGRLYPRQRFLWILILVVVSFSTLFTGQHYIVDVLGGFIVAFAGYHFGLWWAGFLPAQNQSDKIHA